MSGVAASYVSEQIDDLVYTYATGQGNRVTKIDDNSGRIEGFSNGITTTTEYTYNANGSLTLDKNKGISSITHNRLGKPEEVNFSDGKKIEYIYSASGAKLVMKLWQGETLLKTTDYASAFVYEDGQLKFFASPEGRVVKNGSNFEYQYAIADHQGNTRVVFTSATPAPDEAIATFEGDSNDDSGEFDFNPALVVTFPSANHTPGGNKVVRMNQNSPVGPAKSIKVYPGDNVTASVWSYYESGSGYGTSSPATAVISDLVALAFGGVSGGGGEGGLIYNGVTSAFGAFGLGGNAGDQVPAAYLNYILFDKNYKLLDMGWQPVTAQSSWNKAKISLSPIQIKEEGYVFVYLTYENQSNNWVYFDDMDVIHTKTNVIQYNEYYAFGLQTNASWTRVDEQPNQYLYNSGSELNATTGWYETMFRDYDPAIGRFMQVDALAAAYAQWSPYAYAMNNPVLMNDPTGLYPRWYPEWYGTEKVSAMDRFFKDYSEGWSMRGENGSRFGGGGGGGGYSMSGRSPWGYYAVENHGFATYVSTDGGKTFKYSGYTDVFVNVWKEGDANNAQQGGGCWWCTDDQGRFFFNHWQNGNGQELYLNNEEWANYMFGSDYLTRLILKEMDKRYAGSSGGTIIGRMHGETGVSGYSSGYGMLNGSNAYVGDLEYFGVAVPGADGSMTYNLTMTFHDIMDPNFQYYGDKIGAKIYPGTPYNVHISWSLSLTVSPPSTTTQSTRH